jgi:hypothetical protein
MIIMNQDRVRGSQWCWSLGRLPRTLCQKSKDSVVISPATVSAYVTRARCGGLSLLKALDDDCDLILRNPQTGDG